MHYFVTCPLNRTEILSEIFTGSDVVTLHPSCTQFTGGMVLHMTPTSQPPKV